MKRIAIAAALVVCATSALAQDAKAPAPAVDISKPKCEPKPVFPGAGATLRGSEGRRRAFDRDLAAYKTCMTKYMDEQKAQTLAHQNAYTAAVTEFNGTMKEINAAIEAAREPEAASQK
jgi:hypothetical protein